MWKLIGLSVYAGLLSATSAMAGEPSPMSAPVLDSAAAETDNAFKSCACRHPDGYVMLGETACMHVQGESYIARCEMVLNNTTWKKVKDGCGAPDALSSRSLVQRLAELAEPEIDPRLVHAKIIRPVN